MSRLIILLFIAQFSVHSQKLSFTPIEVTEESIIGEWHLIQISARTAEYLSPEEQKKNRIILYPDHTFKSGVGRIKGGSGTWKLDESTLFFLSKNSSVELFAFMYEKNNGYKLMLSTNYAGDPSYTYTFRKEK